MPRSPRKKRLSDIGSAAPGCSRPAGRRWQSPPLARRSGSIRATGDAHHALGCALLDIGRVEEAIEHLRLATVLHDDAAAYHNLAVALRRQHLDDEAAAAYRRAIELDPALTEAHVGLADLLEAAGEDEAAAQSLRTAASLMPGDGAGSVYLARALMLEGDFATAEAKLRAAAALDPTDDEVIRKLGNTLARLGQFAEAADMFERVLAVNPRNCSDLFCRRRNQET